MAITTFRRSRHHAYHDTQRSPPKRILQPATVLRATNRAGGRPGQRRDDEAPASAPNVTTASSNTGHHGDNSSFPKLPTGKLSEIARTAATSKKARGRAILLLVSFLYGTLNVTLRAVYATDGPPAASVLSLVRQCLSVVAFVPILIASKNTEKGRGEEERGLYSDGSEVLRSGDGGDGGEGLEKVRPMWMSALELAFWNFGAQGLINAGLLSSPAARASFLTQTSVVMTPLISALTGERVKSSVWSGCGVALLGLYIITTSATTVDIDVGGIDSAATAAAASTFNQGDAMILLGALSWSTYIFRTSRLANSYSELELQFTKTALLALMYGGWFLAAAASALSAAGTSFLSTGWVEALAPLWSGWNSSLAWLLLAYSAVGPGAVADLLQQQGQKETSASESNIILCMESVFAAACAFFLLGEVSSIKEIVGGLLIVVAAILASR